MSVKTPDQIKAEFAGLGITISGWARDHDFTPRDVILVLNGVLKGRYGKAHRIAVALGMKADPRNANQQAA